MYYHGSPKFLRKGPHSFLWACVAGRTWINNASGTPNRLNYCIIFIVHGDSKRWTQFRKSIFPELHMVCE